MTERKKRKVRIGKVVSNRMKKTVVVAVDRLLRHPVYMKTIKRTSKLYAHDEKNECQPGDKVKLMETRPLSRLKRWRVVEILEKSKLA
ncbi:MAG: 30S ribosomal protein S17 [candidate division Zixibacteria bacterium]|nr:30S ribosomal protein S17 [candidate division Zixibacteria bacterium]